MNKYKIMDKLEGALIWLTLWGIIAVLLVQIYKLQAAAAVCHP